MQRPDFDEIKTFEEFSKYYWYRDELIKICKAHGLASPSGKIQLNKVIEKYFHGENVLTMKKAISTTNKSASKKMTGTKIVRKKVVSELTLKTGLIECGFTFGPKFRLFFEAQTGIRPFKFNVDMVATAKAVKESGDEAFTLGDLLDIFYGKKTYAKYDKSALQWNKFLQDFCADEKNANCKDKLKTAARLWKIVRESDMEKIYSREVLEKFAGEINYEQEALPLTRSF